LLDICQKHGKTIALPVVFPEKRRMRFALLPQSRKHFAKNVYGIWEPDNSHRVFIPSKEFDLILIPGRAFTPQGHRLGAGGGYYDRFLKKCPRAHWLGIAYQAQVQSKLPLEPMDLRLHGVLTSHRFYSR
jgi:5-formyltetrahydrofolate cyclo-ligase